MSTHRFSLKEQLSVRLTTPNTDNNPSTIRANFPELELLWGEGTDADEFDAWWVDEERTIASATSDDLDLRNLSSAGSPTGAAVLFAEVRAIFIVAARENTTTLTLEPGAANGWTALGAALSYDLKPGSIHRLVNGKDGQHPTSSTDKVLRITNGSGATATLGILILGTTV